jgi:hypothetical protein
MLTGSLILLEQAYSRFILFAQTFIPVLALPHSLVLFLLQRSSLHVYPP